MKRKKEVLGFTLEVMFTDNLYKALPKKWIVTHFRDFLAMDEILWPLAHTKICRVCIFLDVRVATKSHCKKNLKQEPIRQGKRKEKKNRKKQNKTKKPRNYSTNKNTNPSVWVLQPWAQLLFPCVIHLHTHIHTPLSAVISVTGKHPTTNHGQQN